MRSGSAVAGLGADIRALDADPLDEDALDGGAPRRSSGPRCSSATRAPRCARERRRRPAPGCATPSPGAWNATRALVNAQLAPAGFGKVDADRPAARATAPARRRPARRSRTSRARPASSGRGSGSASSSCARATSTSEHALAQVVAYLASAGRRLRLSGCVDRPGARAGHRLAGKRLVPREGHKLPR